MSQRLGNLLLQTQTQSDCRTLLYAMDGISAISAGAVWSRNDKQN